MVPGAVERDDVEEFEQLRAAFYALLSRALMAPPTPDFIEDLRQLQGDTSPLGQALRDWAVAASGDIDDLEDEYTKLFYGMGQGGEVLPYASYYLTGMLMDRPLAELRTDMARLGIAHGGINSEPEDHIALLLEMMQGLIVGRFGAGPLSLADQRQFFHKHLVPWASDFFEDLEAADSARFYAVVARVGRAFLQVEEDAFQMAA